MGDKITLFDTSVSSVNLGDDIIMENVSSQLEKIFPKRRFFKVPTHEKLGSSSYKCLDRSEYAIIGGTNLLSSNMPFYKQWEVGFLDSFRVNDVILMGVGWWQYQDEPNIYTQYLLRRLLSNNHLHSVRDSYTKAQLESIGIENTINTGCPTMWGLTSEHCRQIPTEKSDVAVITLTSYNKSPTKDKNLLKIVESNYDQVYFWPQGGDDEEYFKSISETGNVKILDDTLSAFKDILQSDQVDYIGTRLHAGIFALNNKSRSIIISIDNRAKEMSNDFNLVTHSREKISDLNQIIQSEFETQISIPFENIQIWKEQFE